MSKFVDFFPDNIKAPVEESKKIGARIDTPFRALACDEATASRIRTANTARKFDKKVGAMVSITDGDAVMTGLVLACVTYPDFHDAELQAAWGVMGAESLIRKMLLPGEYTELVQWVSELTGYAPEDLEDSVEEAKN